MEPLSKRQRTVPPSEQVHPSPEALVAAAERRAPVFARSWTYATLPCGSWPLLDADRYQGRWDRRTSAPILLVSTVYDPATPYSAAVDTNRTLPGSRLLTVQGHGGYWDDAPPAA